MFLFVNICQSYKMSSELNAGHRTVVPLTTHDIFHNIGLIICCREHLPHKSYVTADKSECLGREAL